MARFPLGLKIVSGFFLVFGAFGVLCFLLGLIVEFLPGEPPGAKVMGAGLYWLVIIIATLLGMLHLLLGVGLVKRKRWGRWLTIAYTSLLFVNSARAALAGDVINLLGAGLAAMLLWYLFRPSIKVIF